MNGYEELEDYYQPPDEDRYMNAVIVYVVRGWRMTGKGKHEVDKTYRTLEEAQDLEKELLHKGYHDVEIYEYDVS